jgi:hypothetical protein
MRFLGTKMADEPTFRETYEQETDPETGKAVHCFTLHVGLPPRRRRKSTLAAALKQAARAGATVSRAELALDGRAVLEFGEAAEKQSDDPLDAELAEFKARHGHD